MMNSYKSIRKSSLAALLSVLPVLSYGQETVRLGNGTVSLEWGREEAGYVLRSVEVDGEQTSVPMYQHRILYSATKPSTDPMPVCDREGRTAVFPDPQYRYIIATWQQNLTPVALNCAGENIVYLPDSLGKVSETGLEFSYEDSFAAVTERWSLDPVSPGDIKVEMTLTAKKPGYWSLSSPSVVAADKYDFRWAAVPGIYQGNAVNPDFIRALAYGQGIPDRPIVSRERTASTLMSMITDRNGITAAVTAEPGTGRDPWESDRKTNSVWKLGLSLMNRDGEFTPTLYHPVLGEDGSYLETGEKVSFSFRYTIRKADWHEVFRHSVEDIYRFSDGVKMKKTSKSLTQRLYDMYRYLVDDSTSMWRNCTYKGVTIGAQDYRGGVYGSEKDAMKNSDYGAMWMLSGLTGDSRLSEKRLPYALNFKLMQQNDTAGFLYGSSAGQYYLYKSSRFTEEWGPYTEPIATTYYMIMDMGNVLLFEPGRKDLKEHLRLAADCLLGWMKPDGSWEVAYDNATLQPMFTDVKDLRPTFYGLLVAYRILGDEKYLDAACKGADWYVGNAVSKGHFLGVCGDTRFAPDFATAQGAQALYDLSETTGNPAYRDAAVAAAKLYTTSVYTHPVPTVEIKTVKGREFRDWEIAQAGLSFEHGGVLGSANHRGPILLASHAGMFVRMFSVTKDSLFLDMARAAVIARDAFVDKSTGVASYYWDSMDAGAGPYPHHAWWQTGWIMDYLVSETELRSDGRITFPAGFITPKVGPHKTYGFAPGNIFGKECGLVMRQGLVESENPYIEYLTAIDRKGKTLYVVLMNNDDEQQTASVAVDLSALGTKKNMSVRKVSVIDSSGASTGITVDGRCGIPVGGYGLSVLKIEYV